MSKIFRTTVQVFTVATVILAIAIAYVLGEVSGEFSQRTRIIELENKLHPGIDVDPDKYEPPPLWHPLLTTAFIFGACWIVIAAIALTQKKKKHWNEYQARWSKHSLRIVLDPVPKTWFFSPKFLKSGFFRFSFGARVVRTALVAAVAIALAVSFAAGFFVGAVMERSRRISNQAAIKAVGVGVYQDPALTVPLTEINWGILEPGEENNHTAYIKNESNVPITLVLTTENWSPLNASSFISLNWDYDAQLLDIERFLEVTFTLTVDPAISGIEAFSFAVVIVGSGWMPVVTPDRVRDARAWLCWLAILVLLFSPSRPLLSIHQKSSRLSL